ncbi:MAG: COX15/CtaA family protein [Betaproteobacteria bacterium]|nr:COX15/CtaA family protein [Betaproteobacteria bacterium]
MTGFERGLLTLISLACIVGLICWIGRDTARYRKLVFATAAAVFVLVVLGAYVRLSDAGLGCPDWPGCYGNFMPTQSLKDIRAAEAVQPDGPVTLAKAWKEMAHRYLAMVVGAMIAALAFAAWWNRRALKQSPGLATGLAVLVIFQAALGAWTVTMLLKPAIVTAHLMGGMAILALLIWLGLRQGLSLAASRPVQISAPLRIFASVGLLVLIGQIILGGWVSTNYAALACVDFPKCAGAWMPPMEFEHAFHVIRPLGVGPDGQFLSMDALRAIHWMHRIGAIITSAVLLALAWQLRGRGLTALAHGLVGLLALQVLIGIGNVIWSLPLPLAVAHNGGAALLLGWLVLVNFRINVPAATH